jgi:hypothetical protein
MDGARTQKDEMTGAEGPTYRKRFSRRVTALAVAIVVATIWIFAHPGSALESKPLAVPAGVALPSADPAKPLTVVVRGWLWDPESRKNPPELTYFPAQLNKTLRKRYGLETTVYQYRWSRIPRDLPTASRDFTEFAKAVAARAAESGQCVNFIGHSAGALMVYSAADRGVPMGYMGTVGLPNVGSSKPVSVAHWINYFTKDPHDLPGILWGSSTAADRNVEAILLHKEMWKARAVIQGSADGIAQAWGTCRGPTCAARGCYSEGHPIKGIDKAVVQMLSLSTLQMAGLAFLFYLFAWMPGRAIRRFRTRQ